MHFPSSLGSASHHSHPNMCGLVSLTGKYLYYRGSHYGGVIAWCLHGSMLGMFTQLFPRSTAPQNHTQGPNVCTLWPLLPYQRFFIFSLMLVTGPRVLISAPCSPCSPGTSQGNSDSGIVDPGPPMTVKELILVFLTHSSCSSLYLPNDVQAFLVLLYDMWLSMLSIHSIAEACLMHLFE